MAGWLELSYKFDTVLLDMQASMHGEAVRGEQKTLTARNSRGTGISKLAQGSFLHHFFWGHASKWAAVTIVQADWQRRCDRQVYGAPVGGLHARVYQDTERQSQRQHTMKCFVFGCALCYHA